jgi:energy-converting hydrogenase Eha subunit F
LICASGLHSGRPTETNQCYGSTWEEADAERTRLKDMQRKGIPVDNTTSTVEQYMQYVDGDRATERA